MTTLIISPDYAYVMGAAISSIFVIAWKGIRVGKARKKYDVKYPDMYSDKHPIFNCVQRAHQNTLENYPQFLICLFLGGLYYPRVTGAAGFLWVISRIFYALGYSTGDPKKRMQGSFGYLGILVLLGTAIGSTLHVAGVLH